MNPGKSDAVVLHITGPDGPGVTASVARIVSQEGGELIDIGQSVLHGYLTLSAIVDLPPGTGALQKLLFAMSEKGLRVELSALPAAALQKSPEITSSMCVTLLGDLRDGKAVAATTQFFADNQLNIRDIRTLSDGDLSGLEFIADLPPDRGSKHADLAQLRGQILRLATELKVDLAVQRDDVFRRNKRLICMDVDSTFIQVEVIDELAKLAGVGDKVAQLTERAMRGELDFKQALAERVALLKGLPVEKAEKLFDQLPLTPGAEKLVRTLKAMGFHIGLVSGGFDFIVNKLKDKFHLDFAVANHLEYVNGVFTGRTVGVVVDAERKAQVIKDMAQAFRCRLEQSVAVGDGANDRLMLQSAGLGIAFMAKPKLQEIAHLSLNQSSLDSILFLMGFTDRDLRGLN
ncbi:MAG: phosphoserine phosphatase SerB [Bdellovibrionales bacterium]|nr:phosphoserine phosphatase SerB [Bdellovibrionales bacterium]